MQKTLLHYAHCPYCIRVRMALGFLNVDFDTKLVSYEDEETPIKLIGKKMLPIFIEENGNPLPESLDIIERYDSQNILKVKDYKTSNNRKEFEDILSILGADVHNLAMPHWIYTKEFSSKAREYFQKKKEQKRGPFSKLVNSRNVFEENINTNLSKLSYELKPFYQSEFFTIKDIMIAAHLWGLYTVPEFQFKPDMHFYLQQIKKLTKFNYQKDFWR